MKQALQSLDDVKNRILNLKGKGVEMQINHGRKKIKTYSGGMKQRLGIAQALINRPEVLILDEPTAGLDPQERARFRDLIADIGRENIVLLSTHILSDIEHIAERIIMMKSGKRPCQWGLESYPRPELMRSISLMLPMKP